MKVLCLVGNPLICSCQSYVQKIWLRQHRKWLSTEKRGSKVGPQCIEPTPLSDRYLLTVKDSELCPLPSVSSLQLSHIRPHSFLLTWESPDTNMTGLKGFIVAYHRLDMNDQVICLFQSSLTTFTCQSSSSAFPFPSSSSSSWS